MTCTTVTTQDQLDAALGDKATCIHIESEHGVWLSLSSSGSATVRAYGSATVEAYGSATVEAYDSATVEAYDSATVRASGSATVRAYGSATVRASGSATVRASGSAGVHAHGESTVAAGSHVAVHLHSAQATVSGGVLIDLTTLDLTDPTAWLDHHGVAVADGKAVLYKALGTDLTAGRDYDKPTVYTVGAEVACNDWRDDDRCGGGLHFSPSPAMASDYCSDASRWVAVEVDVATLRPIDDGGTPKCKSPGCRVVAEVDRFGRELATTTGS